jgi:formylglycine-generating enzyme required for sulfatase activity
VKPPSRDLVRRLAVLLAEAARGIDHLHEHGVIHRDVKPGNLMVAVGDHRTVVMDLGLAKLREATESITLDRSRILGTLRYIPPEQLQQHVRPIDQRVDVYSLGATFYELMTGRPIFDGNTEARLIEQVLLEEPRHPRKVNPAIPRDLSTILRKSVDKDPRLRYPSAADFAEDVERFLADRPIAAQPPTPFYLLALAVKRNKPLAATVAAAFVVVLAALLLFAVTQGELARAEKEKRLSMAVRLDLAQARSLIAEMSEPVPLHPDSREKLERWIRSTRTLLSRRDEFQKMLESRESADGTPIVPRDVASVVSSIDRLATLLPLARDDQKRIEAVMHAGARRNETWPAAIRSIASSPAYASLGAIKPQLGLVPLRENPKTHLWEFWHVASGERPPVEARTGEPRITPASGIVLVLLPGGSYMMGSPEGEEGRDDVERYHEERVEPFFIAKHEVTQAQWERAMRANPAYYPPGTSIGGQKVTGANPVEVVSWVDCGRFARRLALRLPTEAEWEYACRGGTTTPYLAGLTHESLRMRENLKDKSLTRFSLAGARLADWNDGHQIHAPVGSFAPNGFGLYDMQGNVSEWTSDVYVDPAVPPPGHRRALRGGHYMVHPHLARSALRQWNAEKGANSVIGVRVALDVDR